VRASPAVGRVVAAPHELRLKFNEPVEAALSTITLVDAGGAAMALGPAATDPKDASVLVAAVKAPLAPGGYRVRWKAVSADTHKTGGDFTFQVK
jgi:methionine-rich copper-binding protein CopC